ncbi:flagellar basal body rod protein FlgB [Methylococcaceae bacterium]|jgi:flagellar basal-body rod protein FlgB|nr:flagellar basal body rod protein FlgB [Methylococcales bacterium]GDX85238.1 flagellar basal body rod protein FlgB [Methylococcaceae bacterium]
MGINFDTALGKSPQLLALREKRSEVLAANLANADTPNFKARDLDFSRVLQKTMPEPVMFAHTHAAHFSVEQPFLGAQLKYRIPNQVSLDGNTVEEHIEQAKYAENATQYQATLQFLSGSFNDLRSAFSGQA